MTVIRVATALLSPFLLISGVLHAKDEKAEIPKVTVQDLAKNPETYRGKVVQIEGTLKADATGSLRTQVVRFHLRLVEADNLSITAFSKPDVLKGDRVRITGTFWYSVNPPGPFVLSMVLHRPDGKVERLPPK